MLWRLFYGLLAFFPGILTLTRFAKANRDLLTDAGAAFGGDSIGSDDGEAEPVRRPDGSGDTVLGDDIRPGSIDDGGVNE